MVTARRGQDLSAGRGYALVALIVIVAVMNVLAAASLPYWSEVIKRDKEAELVFRGLQYAEAIRVFQVRFNRLPNTLDELIEVNPRSIRQLWKDPMTDDGEWEVVRGQVGQAPGRRATDLAAGGAPRSRSSRQADGRSARGRETIGPIIGVRSRSEDEAKRTFMGGSTYAKWIFTVDLIPVPAPLPESLVVPRPTSDWIGRPFREDLQPKQGSGPGGDLGTARRTQGEGDE